MTNNKNPEQNSDHAKDHFEKKFIDHEDVFADIVNTLLFKGKQRIKEDELESGMTRSAYRVEGLFEEQERDAKKMKYRIWTRSPSGSSRAISGL